MKALRQHTILLVDDDAQMRRMVSRMIQEGDRYQLVEAADGESALQQAEKHEPCLVLLDLTLPGISGQEVLVELKNKMPDVSVIVITGRIETPLAVECMRAGAYDFINKPFDKLRLLTTIEKALEYQESLDELESVRERMLDDGPRHPEAFSGLLTQCPIMNRLFAYAEMVAESSRDVLITGETGTGKDIISKILHQLSGRTGPYVAVNAAGLDDQLFSDALFGHVKGAFTGAQTDRPGLLEKAEHGTLFLDEIGDLSESSQVKLLRVLQEREYMPLGADQPKRTTARFVAATSVDLEEKMREGTFRKDLFFRLRAHPLEVPPLRKRKGDVKKLFDHFLEKCLNESNKSLSSPPVPEVYRLLEKYEFPGNIREIEALVYDVVFRMKDGLLHPAQVAEGLRFGENPSVLETSNRELSPQPLPHSGEMVFPDPLPTIEDMTDQLILEALRRFDDNRTHASQAIGMSRKGLINRLARIMEDQNGPD